MNFVIPKIIFKYSQIYDCMLHYFSTGEYVQVNDKLFLERKKLCERKIKTINSWWKKEGQAILKTIEKCTGMKWGINSTEIYFLAQTDRDVWVGGFSDPITIFLKKRTKKGLVYKNLIYLKSTIIHELVHKNMPSEKITKYLNKLQKKHKCDRITATHILIHSIMIEIYLKHFSKKYIEANINRNTHPSYKLSWEVIEKEGHKNILADFRS